MTSLEHIIRPFQNQDVTPTPFHPAGVVGAEPVRLVVGLRGGTKTFGFSGSATRSSYMQAEHHETPTTDGSGTHGIDGGFTRQTHINRIKNPNDASQFIDVEIMDAVHFTGPDGKQMTLKMAKSPNASVTDNTGG